MSLPQGPYDHDHTPAPAAHPRQSAWRTVLTMLLWIVVGAAALLILVSLIAGQFGGAMVLLGLLGLIIAIIALTVGHFRRMGIRSRKQAGAALAASLALIIGGSAVLPTTLPTVDAASSTPSAASASAPTPQVTVTATVTASALPSASSAAASPSPTPTPPPTLAPTPTPSATSTPSPTPTRTQALAAPRPQTSRVTTQAPRAAAPSMRRTTRPTPTVAPAPVRAPVAAPKKTLAPAPAPKPTRTAAAAAPKPAPLVGGGTDPDMGTCKAAKAAGLGPYRVGVDPEYHWYKDADSDGIVCE